MTSEADPGRSIAGATGVMALGTVASRATGFLRVAVMVYALGISQVADAYNLANTVPNIVYELLLGGVLTSIVVPLIVQATREDGDDGQAFGSALLTAVVTVLGAAVVALMVFAPQIVNLLSPRESTPGERELATTLLRYFLPQVLFYGLGAAMTAVLNTRRVFGVPMFAPALNNLVVVATGLVFTQLSGPTTGTGLTTTQIAVLGAGTTLGVVVMTVALLPALRRSGFHWRPTLRGHPGLRRAARLGVWVAGYVVVNQVGLFVVIRLARAATVGGYSAYTYAFLLFQLPHAIVSVSVISALLPRMSGHAVDRDHAALRDSVSYGARLVISLLVPAAVGLVLLAAPVAVAIMSHGRSSVADAEFVGQVLAVFGCGLVSFSLFQLLLRVFYALQDTRTPTLVNVACVAVNIGADLLLFSLLDGRRRVLGLAAGHALAYTFGAVVFAVILRRRLGGLDLARVTRTATRVAVGAAIMGLGVYGAARMGEQIVQGSTAAAVASILSGVAVGAPLYLVCADRMSLTEVAAVTEVFRQRLRGRQE